MSTPGVVHQRGLVRTVSSLLSELDDQLLTGTAEELVPVATGFLPLDRVLGGGLHPGALTIIGGAPGVGKTAMMLQWARNIAAAGRHAIYVCYEHEESELLLRLVAMELGDTDPEQAERLHDDVAASAASAKTSLGEILDRSPTSRAVLTRIQDYASRLHIVRASGAHTAVGDLSGYLTGLPDAVLFVDYLQKVRCEPDTPIEAERVTRVAEGLKDLALTASVPIVAAVAVDLEGLRSRRIKMHHFRGSSALVFEADVAIVVNEKFDAVSKVHLAYDPVRAAGFREWVVLTIEKNRGGPSLIDLEHRKDLARYRFDPVGQVCEDRLADDRVEVE